MGIVDSFESGIEREFDNFVATAVVYLKHQMQVQITFLFEYYGYIGLIFVQQSSNQSSN